MSSHAQFQLLNVRYRPLTTNKRLKLHAKKSVNHDNVSKLSKLIVYLCQLKVCSKFHLTTVFR